MAERPTLNIEFAHVYLDIGYGAEQQASIACLQQLIHEKRDYADIQTCILIDDLNPQKIVMDVDDYLAWVQSQGAVVDFIAYESDFAPVAQKLINRLPQDKISWESSRKNETVNLVLQTQAGKIGLQSKDVAGAISHSCTALSSAWTLCRMGVFPFPEQSLISLTGKTWKGDQYLSLLPSKFQSTEAKAFSLIQVAGLEDILVNFGNQFHE